MAEVSKIGGTSYRLHADIKPNPNQKAKLLAPLTKNNTGSPYW